MPESKARLIADEFARRGRAIYRRKVRPRLAKEKKGRIVAIDVNTGDFEVADKVLAAAQPLLKRRPGAKLWVERIGFPTLRHFGGWRHMGRKNEGKGQLQQRSRR